MTFNPILPTSRSSLMAVTWLILWHIALVGSVDIDPDVIGGRSLTVDPNANPIGTCEEQSVADCPRTCIRTLGEWIKCTFTGGYDPLRFLGARSSPPLTPPSRRPSRLGRAVSEYSLTTTEGTAVGSVPPITNGCVSSGVATSEVNCARKFDHELHPSPHD